MSFDPAEFNPTPSSFGTKGSTIDYSGGDVTLATSVKAVAICATGNVVYRPRGETNGSITLTSWPAGATLPHIPGVVIQTGTTATLCTVED